MRPPACLLFCLLVGAMPITVTGAAPSSGPALIEESALNRHVHAIADQLRCLVCQGQTVADSNSGLASDMRVKIREKLKQGWSDQQVRDYFVARYGDFVLYRPPLESSTWALWFGPLIMLVAGLAWLLGHLRRRARLVASPAGLSEQEVQRARVLLGAGKEDES